MSDWRWVSADVVFAIHERQLAEHGGLSGLRDGGAVLSAVARPKNLAAYGDPDAAELAGAYAWGPARSHAFSDGNKRTAWVVARVFLADNGCGLDHEPEDAVATVEAVAQGAMAQGPLAAWFRARLRL